MKGEKENSPSHGHTSFLTKDHAEELRKESLAQLKKSKDNAVFSGISTRELEKMNNTALSLLLSDPKNTVEKDQDPDSQPDPSAMLKILSVQRRTLLHNVHMYASNTLKAPEIIDLVETSFERQQDIILGIISKTRSETKLFLENTVQKLEDTTDELSRSNQELTEFAYMASHDLQEPLRMIASYTQLLQRRYKDKLDETGNEFIEFAVDGTRRMRSLIDDLLEYSRAGRGTPTFREIDTTALLKKVTESLRTEIEQTHAEITWDEAIPSITGDPTMLILLFQNLIGNAIKFRAGNTPKITVSVEQRTNDNLVSVKDNGIGLAEEYYERIFLAFRKLHSREEYSGTGIGLAVCKKIVQRHNGKIWVESVPGSGSVFYFTLDRLLK